MVMKRIKIRSSDSSVAAKVIRFHDGIALRTLIENIIHKLGLWGDFDQSQDVKLRFELCLLHGNHLLEFVEDINNDDEIVLRSKSTTSTKTGEYDAVLPVTAGGLLLKLGETPDKKKSSWTKGSTYFLGYYPHPDGTKAPEEFKNNLIHGFRDKVIAVDGTSTHGKSFKQVMTMIKTKCAAQKFITLRFQEYTSQLKRKADTQNEVDDKAANPDGDEDDDSDVEDVTEQCLEQRISSRTYVELSSSDDNDHEDGVDSKKKG